MALLPRLLTGSATATFPAFPLQACTMPSSEEILYSERYSDDVYEYRHLILPADIASRVPKNRLMSEPEWRALGVQQSRGWVEYTKHHPEPHILLFRRPKNFEPPVRQARSMPLPPYRALGEV
ncbi:hypothetical protein ABPG77_008048 [Micractinium sp. CCAP 211/92]